MDLRDALTDYQEKLEVIFACSQSSYNTLRVSLQQDLQRIGRELIASVDLF